MIETVKELLGKQLHIDPAAIDDDASILEDLGADSLEVVEMLMTIEDKFGIVVPDEDVPELRTVRSVAEYLQKNAE